MKSGPELELIEMYMQRYNGIARQLGLGPMAITELDDKRIKNQSDESEALLKALKPGSYVIAMDERGKNMPSRDFAKKLGSIRDQSPADICLLIGGADGHTDKLRKQSDMMLSFGAMAWPHMLARVMLTEQLYRAATILAGHPYHRE